MVPTKYFTVEQIKQKRVAIDALIQEMDEQKFGVEGMNNEDEGLYFTASHQAFVSLIAAKMWLGKMLEGRGTPFPAELADKAHVA